MQWTSSFFFSASLCGLQDLSSPSRDRTRALALKALSPNHWTTREFLDHFLERHNMPILTQEDIDHTNRAIYILNKLNKKLITFRNRKYQAQMDSLVNSTKHLRKKLYQLSTISFRG